MVRTKQTSHKPSTSMRTTRFEKQIQSCSNCRSNVWICGANCHRRADEIMTICSPVFYDWDGYATASTAKHQQQEQSSNLHSDETREYATLVTIEGCHHNFVCRGCGQAASNVEVFLQEDFCRFGRAQEETEESTCFNLKVHANGLCSFHHNSMIIQGSH